MTVRQGAMRDVTVAIGATKLILVRIHMRLRLYIQILLRTRSRMTLLVFASILFDLVIKLGRNLDRAIFVLIIN